MDTLRLANSTVVSGASHHAFSHTPSASTVTSLSSTRGSPFFLNDLSRSSKSHFQRLTQQSSAYSALIPQQIATHVSATAEYATEERRFPNSAGGSREGRILAPLSDEEDEVFDEFSESSDAEILTDDESDPLNVVNLGLVREVEQALLKRGITRLFPIQEAVMKPAMAGRDVIARAKTGTGKTLAFGIPILDKISRQNEELKTRWRGGPRCLVLAPTRELANQVNRELMESAPHLTTLCVYGGVSIDGQIRQLKRGVDIVVGTPGRITDLMERGTLNLNDVKYLVLDEADQMLAVGFEEDVERILQLIPEGRQTQLFSATMPSWVNKLSRKYLVNPLTIDLVGEGDDKLSDLIRVICVKTPNMLKRSILVDLITVYGKGGKSIVFTQTKRDADDVSVSLSRTVGCQALHGDIAQQQREKTLQAFRDGRFGVLVATDVAARGLDIPNVDLVIHYEIPNDPETFVHRSGRTGRAGKTGTAILMHTDSQIRTLRVIERDLNSKFERISPPHVEDVLTASSDQAVIALKQVHPELSKYFIKTAQQLLEEEGVNALASALAHISGYTQPPPSRSLLNHEEGFTTVRLVRNNLPLSSTRSVLLLLRDVLPAAAASVGKIKLISDRNVDGAVFDLPEDIAKELAAIQNTENGDTFDIPKQLPQLIEEAGRSDRRTDNYGRFSSRGGGSRGSSRSGGSYGGDRGSFGADRYGSRSGTGGGDRYGDRASTGSRFSSSSRSDSDSFSSRGGRSSSVPAGSGRLPRLDGDRYSGGGRAAPRSRTVGSGSESWEYGLDDDFYSASAPRQSSSGGGSGRSFSGNGAFGGVCFVCKQPGHRAADCPSQR